MADDQTNCSVCGVRILVSTAESNDGRCVPCARGTRPQMERNRQWHEDQKKYREGPEWQFWMRLVKMDFVQMTPAQQQYFAVNCVRAEVENGGFDQYFSNSAGDQYLAATEGLMAMGAGRSLDILRRAKRALFADGPVQSRRVRWIAIKGKQDAATQAILDELNQEFWDDPDDLIARMRAFARQHDLFPVDQG